MTDATHIRLSILVPAFNPGNWGRLAIDSILPQLSPHDEIVIQDGGTNQEWLSNLAADDRIKIVSEPDEGQADALNRALARARGEWVMWLNADDIVFDEAISHIDFDQHSSPVLSGAFATIDASSSTIRSFFPSDTSLDDLILRGCTLYSGSTIFRSDFLRDIGGFDGSFHFCMDYELFLRATATGVSPAILPVRIGALRIHAGTKTTSTPWSFVAEARRARLPYLGSTRRKVFHIAQTAYHAILISTTRLRASRLYSQLRGRVS